MRHFLSLFATFLFSVSSFTQNVDVTLQPNIQGIKLYLVGNQLGYPIMEVNNIGSLELHFDDLDGRVKNYYYTYQLCNADWTPVNLSTFDYLRGFSQIHLNQYRQSSISQTKYIHYQAVLPEKNCVDRKSVV